MENKKLALYIVIFAVAYLIFTSVIIKHGVHLLNSTITTGILVMATYLYLKKE
ncbi:hypothetical protein ISS07_03695 [Candidatus Woesearchaeota archaeon]|nr:hypothetical protein [Candidatus Woesearchaeota archaeon]